MITLCGTEAKDPAKIKVEKRGNKQTGYNIHGGSGLDSIVLRGAQALETIKRENK